MSDEVKKFITGLGAMAEACHAFYSDLIKKGFSEFQALELTKMLLTKMLV